MYVPHIFYLAFELMAEAWTTFLVFTPKQKDEWTTQFLVFTPTQKDNTGSIAVPNIYLITTVLMKEKKPIWKFNTGQ